MGDAMATPPTVDKEAAALYVASWPEHVAIELARLRRERDECRKLLADLMNELQAHPGACERHRCCVEDMHPADVGRQYTVGDDPKGDGASYAAALAYVRGDDDDG